MNAPHHPVQTCADIMAMVEQTEHLTQIKKRDLLSAIRRVCEMLGCSPASLKVEVPTLRKALDPARPAAHGISPRTFSNLRSLFGTALELAGITESLARGTARRDPAWSSLVKAIAGDKSVSMGLAAFLNWCAENGIGPADVDDAVLQRFQRWLETRTLHPRLRNLIRQIPRAWARAQALVPDWPTTELARISFRSVSVNLRWGELPQPFRADAEVYLNGRANPDLFADDALAPSRPLAPATIRQQREHIRLAASILSRHGADLTALCGLADLVDVDAMKTVLRHYHEQAHGKLSAFAVGLGITLNHVARYHVRAPEAQLAELRKVARKLPKVPFDLTEKNKILLANLESERMRGRLLGLPEVLMHEVKAALRRGGRMKFVDAQVAAAVELLLVAPLRPQNLIDLNWSRHFKEPGGPSGRLVLRIPKEETKTKQRDLVFELPSELAEAIRWYRIDILPRLGGDPSGDLFVSKRGSRKKQDTFGDQIIDRIKKQVGIHMTPHQFRHFAALLYLESHPEDFRTITDLLGHSFSKTTLIYAGATSRRASVTYGNLVIEQRKAASLKSRRRHRGTRK